jgi:hypothetical protein
MSVGIYQSWNNGGVAEILIRCSITAGANGFDGLATEGYRAV